MPLTSGVIVACLGLTIVIAVHIVVIARWSGRIDGYITSNAERMNTMDVEIRRLRDARHEADGKIQRQEGMLREMQRLFDRRVPSATED